MASQTEVAAHLTLSDRQVRNLIAAGILPASVHRRGLDLDACRDAYIGYMRGRTSGQVKAEAPPEDFEESEHPVEIQLIEQRLRLTTAQAVSQEKKNEVEDQQLVPVGIAIFVLSKIAAQLGSMLDTLPLKLMRKHPDIDPRHLESLTREIALARNLSAETAERLPDDLNEYFETLAD